MKVLTLRRDASGAQIMKSIQAYLDEQRQLSYAQHMEIVEKHPGPSGGDTHSTGTDQSVHGGRPTPLAEPHTITGPLPEGAPRIEQDPDSPYRTHGAGKPPLPDGFNRWLADWNKSEVEDKIKKLNRKAERLGLPPFELVHSGLRYEEVKEIRDDNGRKTGQETVGFEAVAVLGAPPQIPGFEFMAAIQHLPVEGNLEDPGPDAAGQTINLLRAAPGVEPGDIPEEFRNAGPDCVQCGRAIYRKDTFLVRDTTTGEIKQCGRTCLKDFTGHNDPTAWADLVYMHDELDDMMRDPSRDSYGNVGYDTRSYLAYTAAMIESHGFTGTSAVPLGGSSTRDMVNSVMRPGKSREALLPNGVQDRHWELAEKAQTWAAELTDEDMGGNGYLWNIHVIAGRSNLPKKSEGYAASIIGAYERELGIQAERKLKAEQHAAAVAERGSEWVGEVGKLSDFESLTVTSVKSWDNNYGTTFQYTFRDADNNLFMWRKSGAIVYTRELGDDEVAKVVESMNASRDAAFEAVHEIGAKLAEGEETVELLMPHLRGVKAYRELYVFPKSAWDAVLAASPAERQEEFKLYTEEAAADLGKVAANMYRRYPGTHETVSAEPFTPDDIRAEPRSFGLNNEHLAEPGDIFSFRAKVKEHGRFRDEAQTVLTGGRTKSIRWLGRIDDEEVEKAAAALAGTLQ